jgi:pyruvate dehydrogenase E1 component alpha subunit
MQGIDRVVVDFFGDGATNEGSFHEALNLAAIWKLPVLFVCENNQYGMSMHVSRHMAIQDIAVRASSYGLPGRSVDGNDIFQVYEAALQAREHVRTKGPLLLVTNTYRIMGHSKSDANVYRTKEEVEEWRKRCPIKRMKDRLLAERLFSAAELQDIETRAERTIREALEFAEASPEPALETATEDVYAEARS